MTGEPETERNRSMHHNGSSLREDLMVLREANGSDVVRRPRTAVADGNATASLGLGDPCKSPHLLRAKKVALIGNQVETLIRFRGPLIRDIVSRGNVVYALVPGYTEQGRKEVRRLGAIPIEIQLHRTSLSVARCLKEAYHLRKLLRELRPDVVLAYFLRPIIVGSVAARLAGVPARFCLVEGAGYIFTTDETDDFGRRALRALVTALFRTVLAGIDRVFVLNPDDEALVVGSRIVAADHVTRLPGIGIDLKFFRPAPQIREPVTFMLAARLIPEKGIRDYVAAARRVKLHQPDTRFLLLGSADEHPSRIDEQEVSRWVGEGLIEWPGHVEDVRPYIAQTSVYVLPSFYREGLPRSLLEAMAMARPIITTDAPGCRQAVLEGENGFLVPMRDPKALAAAMMRFVRQPDLIASMGCASRQFAEQAFDVRDVNATLIRAMTLEQTAPAPSSRRDGVLRSTGSSSKARRQSYPLPARE